VKVHFPLPLLDQKGYPFTFIGIDIPQDHDLYRDIPADREFLQAMTALGLAFSLKTAVQHDTAFQVLNHKDSVHLDFIRSAIRQTELQGPTNGEIRAPGFLPVEIQFHH